MLTHDKSSHGLWPGELKKKMAKILKLAIKNIYPNCQHYTDIDPSVITQPHISCL
jgi:hypothetical protein